MIASLLLLLMTLGALLASPLTAVTGYESSQVLAILLPPIILFALGASLKLWARGRPPVSSGLWLGLVAMPALPLAVLAVNAVRVPNCAPGQGLAFYLLLVGGNVAVQAGAWVWLASWLPGRWPVRLAWLIVAGGALLLTASQPLMHPQLFAYSAFWGFFPGPLYDEVLVIDPKILLSRATGFSMALFFWAGALARRNRNVDHTWWRRVSLLGLTLAVVGWSQFPRFKLTGWTSQVQRALGGQVQTQHAMLHYPLKAFTGAEGRRDLDAVVADIDHTYESVADWLELKPAERLPVTVYLYRNGAEKKQFIGAGRTQFANVWRRELHLNHEDPPHSVLRHEMIHLLAADWAPPSGIPLMKFGLVEGLAEAGERTDVRFTSEVWSRYLEETGKRIPLGDMLAPWDFWRAPANRAYGEWGAFLGWLINQQGMARFRQVYGGASFESAYGKDLSSLDAEWVESLKSVQLTPFERWSAEASSRRRSLFEKPCARELARLRDQRDEGLRYGEGDNALAVCGEIDAFGFDVVDDLWRWVQAAAHTDNRPEFARLSERLRRHPDLDEGMRRNLDALEADMAWRDGNVEEALAGYYRAAVPDWNSGPQREIALKIATIESGDREAQEALYRYLDTTDAPAEAEMFLLRMAQRESPAAWAFSYLLMRRLVSREAWEEIEAWESALRWREGFPEFRLDWERRRALARLDYERGRLAEAALEFDVLATQSPWRGEERELRDWAERARWRQGRNETGPATQ